MWIENINTPVEEPKDLHDLSWIIPEGTDLFSKMDHLIGNTDAHLQEVADANNEAVLSVASERLGFSISWMDEETKHDFLATLDSSLTA